MTRDELVVVLRRHKLMVEATNAPGRAPQSAIVGYGVTDQCELVFDTVETTRKFQNLRADPKISAVIAWEDGTIQLEGVADIPSGVEAERIRDAYFVAYPDGRDRLKWPGITHVRVRPRWVRVTRYTTDPPTIAEVALD